MREVPKSVEEAFYAGTRTSEVPFVINDCVDIVAGPHAGRSGAVISVESFRPEVTVLVEFGDDGKDAIVPIALMRHCQEKGR